MVNGAHHFTPDLFGLLVETIPRLCSSKRALLSFFRGAGVPSSILADIEQSLQQDRDSINKYAITRTVLSRLNERSDDCIGPRREVIRRVVEFEDYTSCWEKDRLEAEGLVSRVRQIVNVKDSFTRINLAREQEISARLASERAKAEGQRQRKQQLGAVRDKLFALFAETDANRRGKALEPILTELFGISGMLVREPFEVVGPDGKSVVEQIDGAVDLDGEIYLVEMKWHKEKLGPLEVNHHLSRLLFRGEARGIFISASGYTPAAIEACRKALVHRVVVLCTLEEIVRLLENEGSLADLIKTKVRSAITHGDPFFGQDAAS